MTRGRKPKPPALKLLDGNPGKRKIPTPAVVSGAPDCPEWLTDEAQAEWDRVVPDLDAKGLLDKVDRAALTAYCQAVSILKEAEAAIEDHGIITFMIRKAYRDEDGNEIEIEASATPNPAVRIAAQAATTVRSFASEFGLTPVSRARLPTSNEPDEDSATRLLS